MEAYRDHLSIEQQKKNIPYLHSVPVVSLESSRLSSPLIQNHISAQNLSTVGFHCFGTAWSCFPSSVVIYVHEKNVHRLQIKKRKKKIKILTELSPLKHQEPSQL